MVESDERTRMEGHSFVNYASLYYRQNQTGNSYLIKKINDKFSFEIVSFYIELDVCVDQRVCCQFLWSCHDFHQKRRENQLKNVNNMKLIYFLLYAFWTRPYAIAFIFVFKLYRFARMFSAFTMDVIARCAFGLNIDTLGNNDDPFIQNAQFVLNPPINKSPFVTLLCKKKNVTHLLLGDWIICLFSIVMYPNFLTSLGSIAERLFITKELRFFFQLLENILKERSQSKEVYVFG